MPSEVVESAEALLALLRENQLLPENQLAELTGRTGDSRALARDLIQRGWLTPFQVNQILTGRGTSLRFGPYLLLERLGEGATGQVYKARHQKMARVVALKVLRSELLTDPEIVQRFYREVQVISHLSHPHIVHAFDAGQIGKMHFLVMEYVEGFDLAQVVKRQGPLPVMQVCTYLYQSALGLQHAHEKGLVHRDIKPSNLIVSRRRDVSTTGWGDVKILDLGLARVPRQSHEHETSMLSEIGRGMMGTPDFLAPEQALEFHSADIRADIYSLGCTAYFLLVGEPPFAGGTLAQKLLRHQQIPPPPLASRRPDVSPELLAIIDRLLAKLPDARFQTPRALAEALAPLIGATLPPPASGVLVTAIAEPASNGISDDTALLAPTAIPVPSPRWRIDPRRRWLVYNGIGAAVLLLALWGFVSLLTRSGPGKETAATSPATSGEDPTISAYAALEGRHRRTLSGGDDAPLRLDLIKFQHEHPGTPQAVLAGSLMRDLPSPFDRLSNESIPADQRRPWQPPELVAALGEHRGRTWGEPTCLSISPDGKRIAAGCSDGWVHLFDSGSLLDAVSVRGHTALVESVTFTPDNQLLISTGQDSTVRFWSINGQPREVGVLQQPAAYVHSAAVAPSGKLIVTACADGLVHVYNSTGNGKWTEGTALKGNGEQVQHLAFSPDGKILAAGAVDGLVRLWDLGDPGLTERPALKGHTSGITSLSFHPTGKVLFSSGVDKTLRLWDLQDAEKSQIVHRDDSYRPSSVSVSPDGKLLAFSHAYNRPIQLWDISDLTRPRALSPLKGNNAQTTAVAFIPGGGGTLASVGEDRRVRLWDAASTPPQERPMQSASDIAQSNISSVAVAPDDTMLAVHGRFDTVVRTWSLGEPAPRERFKSRAYSGIDAGLAFSLEGKVLCSADYQTLVLCPTTGDRPVPNDQKPTHNGRVGALALSPDGKTVATGGMTDQTVRLWEVASGPPKERFSFTLKEKSTIHSLAFTPDGRTLAILADHKVHAWDLTASPPAERPAVMTDVGEQAHSLQFSPDGKILAVVGSKDGTATLWDWSSSSRMQVRRTVGGPVSGPGNENLSLTVMALVFAPDGKTVAVGGQGVNSLQVYDVVKGKKPHTWFLPGAVTAVAYSADGRHLISGNGNGTVYVLRLAAGRP